MAEVSEAACGLALDGALRAPECVRRLRDRQLMKVAEDDGRPHPGRKRGECRPQPSQRVSCLGWDGRFRKLRLNLLPESPGSPVLIDIAVDEGQIPVAVATPVGGGGCRDGCWR